jgi:hypothetical protein
MVPIYFSLLPAGVSGREANSTASHAARDQQVDEQHHSINRQQFKQESGQ